jgi:putative tricarboxylic transport membrane protein
LVLYEAVELEYYSTLGPGPGFFPFWVGLVLALLSGIMIWQAATGAREPLPPDFFPQREGRVQLAAIVVSMVGTMALLDVLGFRLTMLAFFLVLLRTLGRSSLPMTLAIAVAGSFGTFYLFDRHLQVPLPTGVLGF